MENIPYVTFVNIKYIKNIDNIILSASYNITKKLAI